MPIATEASFNAIYQRYVTWIQEHACSGIAPKEKEEIVGYQTLNEDIYEGEDFIINRVYFSIPLFPTQSCSGRLEAFQFSELNLLLKTSSYDDMDIIPVGYRIE